ncbi:MAG TPA: alpha/beta hydrolase-fold protein [Flavisolibacter sp.]
MLTEDLSHVIVEQKAIASAFLRRYVIIDLYLPKNIAEPSELSLLLINDGQDLDEMTFSAMINQLHAANGIRPLLCVGIHAGKDRKNEYGTSATTDFAGRGAKAAAYSRFVLEELLPFIHAQYAVEQFRSRGFCGFSLSGLTALDMAWHHPEIFRVAGVFSGSLWWRSRDVDEDYDDDQHRIMHQLVRGGHYTPGLRFYFTTGSLDETADRNQNGIIDSIDDTLGLIAELEALGYEDGKDIRYVNFEDGKHDVATWGRAMPGFLLWGWCLPEMP